MWHAGSYFPDQGLNPCLLQSKCGVSISHRDVLRERVFKEVTELMKSLGWALIQHNWYPYKWTLGH